MTENTGKSNIQGVEIHPLKINNNGQKTDRASLGRIQTGVSSTLPIDPKKGRANKPTILNVYRQIDTLTMEKNMNERMNLDKPCIGS